MRRSHHTLCVTFSMWRTVRHQLIQKGARRLVVRTTTYHPLVGTVILLVVILPFTPLGKSVVDDYVPYSGRVIDKGFQHDFLGDGSNPYLVIEDARGVRTKRYVSLYTHGIVQVGSYVEKKRGFTEIPLRPGQQDPRNRTLLPTNH